MLTDERRTGAVRRPATGCAAAGDQRRLHRRPEGASARRGPHPGTVEADHRPALRVGGRVDGDDERHVPRGLQTLAGSVPHPDVPRLPRQLRRSALPRAARRVLQRVVPEHGQELLGRRVRQTAVDAVQHQRAVRQPRPRTPRLAELPRRAPRERTDLAVQRDGQVGPVHRLPDQDGAGDHLVLTRRGQRLHLLAGRPAQGSQASAAADQQPRRGRAERDDGAPRRGQRPTGSTDSGTAWRSTPCSPATRPTATTGCSRTATTLSPGTTPTNCASWCTGRPRCSPTSTN